MHVESLEHVVTADAVIKTKVVSLLQGSILLI